MLTMKILGGEMNIRDYLARWPEVLPVGGHTDVLVDETDTESLARGQAIFASLVTEHKWTAIDTTTPSAPRRIDVLDLTTNPTELVLLPQIAGG